MHLKPRHLEIFDALMEHGSVSRAAERLALSQPAVSIALANLETHLGFRLFIRTRGYFAPTPEAQLLHGEAELGLLALARFEARAREIAGGAVGSVTLAANGASAINFLPRVISDFRLAHPSVDVDLKVRSSRQVASWVAAGQIDIGMIDAPVPVAGLTAEIVEVGCVAILREDDPLAAKPSLDPTDLSGVPLIGITGDHAIDRRIEQVFADAGAALHRPVTGSFFAIARNLVRAGAGVAIIDRLNGTETISDGVVARPFLPEVRYELAILRLPGRTDSTPVTTMLELIRGRLTRYRQTGAEPEA